MSLTQRGGYRTIAAPCTSHEGPARGTAQSRVPLKQCTNGGLQEICYFHSWTYLLSRIDRMNDQCPHAKKGPRMTVLVMSECGQQVGIKVVERFE